MPKSRTSYADQLKHPEWQKKRLKIMERDDFTCQCCGSRDKTLNVHHHYYSGALAWDYPDEVLITLCEKCHLKEESDSPSELLRLDTALKLACIPSWVIAVLRSSFECFHNNPTEATKFILEIQRESYKRNGVINREKLVEMATELTKREK